MVDFPKLRGKGAKPSTDQEGFENVSDGGAVQDNKEPARVNRVVLSEGAIFPAGWMVKTASEKSDNDDTHHIASIGDIVAMTDEEFDRHQAAGVCVVNAEEREAA